MANPRTIGPYRVEGALTRRPAGVVYRGTDPTGAVLIAMPAAEPAELATAFVHRVTAVNDPSLIENSSLYAGRPWAAVSPDRPEVACFLAGVPLPTRGNERGQGGGQGRRDRSPARTRPRTEVLREASRDVDHAGPDPAALRWLRRRAVLVSLAVFGVIMVVVVGSVLWPHRDDLGSPDPDTTTAPTPYGPRPTNDPVRGPRPAVPMLSHTWQPGDATYRMRLGGMPSAFLAPRTWGCMVRGDAVHVAYTCINEHGVDQTPSILRLHAEPCSACSAGQQQSIIDRIGAAQFEAPKLYRQTRAVGRGTRVEEVHLTGEARRTHTWPHTYVLARVTDRDHDGDPDTLVLALVRCSDTDRLGVEKMLGDLYDGTR